MKLILLVPDRNICIIMGDFNAKVGEGIDAECGIGPYGHGTRNERGDMLASFCQANEMSITNTYFQQPNRRRYSWISPLDESRHQIDYFLINKSWLTSVINAKSCPGADSDSDHLLIKMKVRIKAIKQKQPSRPSRFNVELMKDDDSTASTDYNIETNNRFDALLKLWNENESLPEEIWTEMKKVYLETAESVLGTKKKKPPKPFLSNEVLDLIEKKRKARIENKKEEYKRLKREVRRTIRKDKSTWLENECAKITEANAEKKSKELFKHIGKVKRKNTICFQNQTLKDSNGETLTEMEQILSRWHEYGSSLFDSMDIRDENLEVQNFEPPPLRSEVENAVKKLKDGKAPGLDNIPGELLKYSGSSSMKALHHLCTTIWISGEWPTDWKRQEFVMLHKSGDTKDCTNYRTIALISHASKILLSIILNRLKAKVEMELSDCQAGYRKGRGTTDMLFVLQLIIEKIRNTEDEAFITFIDYSKAFDSVNHNHLFKTMIDLGFPQHLVSLISNMYTNQKATIRWNGEHSKFFDIKKGVRQGCILSPHLFSIYTEMIMRNADIDGMGVGIGGRNITDLRYADDTALLAHDLTSMKRILHRVNTEGKKAGLQLNAKKTKVMHINGNENVQNIKVNNTNLDYVKNFKYLGSIKENTGSCRQDVRTRIAMAKQKTLQLTNIWKDRGIPKSLKVKLLRILIWPVLLYGAEAWTLRKAEKEQIESAEMWFYRRILRVKWTEKRTNRSILEELSVQRQLLKEIDKRRLRYVGHANRSKHTHLMTTALQGKVEGKRRKGRPPISYIGNLIEASGLGSLQQIVGDSRDRAKWRKLVATRGAPTVDVGDGER